MEFYERHFTHEEDPADFSLLTNVPAMVTREKDLELCRYLTTEEVKQVVLELIGENASCPDVFTGTFYQRC